MPTLPLPSLDFFSACLRILPASPDLGSVYMYMYRVSCTILSMERVQYGMMIWSANEWVSDSSSLTFFLGGSVRVSCFEEEVLRATRGGVTLFFFPLRHNRIIDSRSLSFSGYVVYMLTIPSTFLY
ncbi:hypothetical protein H2248_005827 [Termitomyces sp. 'cryptogamus']|nr:hypothetical protein H2248_005827 [Termitomyces sp. 'cryptogamus']